MVSTAKRCREEIGKIEIFFVLLFDEGPCQERIILLELGDEPGILSLGHLGRFRLLVGGCGGRLRQSRWRRSLLLAFELRLSGGTVDLTDFNGAELEIEVIPRFLALSGHSLASAKWFPPQLAHFAGRCSQVESSTPQSGQE